MEAKLKEQFPQFAVVPSSKHLKFWETKLRDRESSQRQFVEAATILLKFLLEFVFEELDYDRVEVQTRANEAFVANSLRTPLHACSILRSGEAVEDALRSLLPDSVSFGKLLIQRDESSSEKTATFMYARMPSSSSSDEQPVLLLDPMLATSGSAQVAIKKLVEEFKIAPEKIIMVSLVAAPEGVQALLTKYPTLRAVRVLALDDYLNEKKYMCVMEIGAFFPAESNGLDAASLDWATLAIDHRRHRRRKSRPTIRIRSKIRENRCHHLPKPNV